MRMAAGALILSLLACGSGPSPGAPDPSPSSGTTIRLVGSTPASGSTVVPAICPRGLCAPDVTMTLEIRSERTLEYPILQVELLADLRCGLGYSFDGPAFQEASQPLRLTAHDFVLGGADSDACEYPDASESVTTVTARASVSVKGNVVARSDFPVRYTFSGPPLAPNPTTPLVTEICWEIPGPSGGWCGDQPLPDDSTDYRCQVKDDDGDEVTVTMTFRSVEGCGTDKDCWTESRTFGRRLVPLPFALEARHVYPETRGARVTCQAVDSHGRSSPVESVCFGRC